VGVSQLVSQSACSYCKTWRGRGWGGGGGGEGGGGEVRGYWIVTDHGRPDQTREMSPQAPLAALQAHSRTIGKGPFCIQAPPPHFMHCAKFVAISPELLEKSF
jgi:hypothetical protein